MLCDTPPQKYDLLPTFSSAYFWFPTQLNPLDMTFRKLPVSVARIGQQVNLQDDWQMHLRCSPRMMKLGATPKESMSIHLAKEDLSISSCVARHHSKPWGYNRDQDRQSFPSQDTSQWGSQTMSKGDQTISDRDEGNHENLATRLFLECGQWRRFTSVWSFKCLQVLTSMLTDKMEPAMQRAAKGTSKCKSRGEPGMSVEQTRAPEQLGLKEG